MLARLKQMLIKEFIQVFRDKRTRFVLFGPPIIQMLVFGYAATFEIHHVPTVVLDLDHSQESRELISRFSSSPYFDVQRQLTDYRQIGDLIDQGKATVGLEINAGFAQNLRKGQTAPLQVIVDATNSNSALIASGYITQIALGFAQDYQQDRIYRISPQMVERMPSVQLEQRPWYNPDLRSRWFFVPGIIGSLTLVLVVTLTAFAVVREREIGTLEQIMVTPIRPAEFILGKTLPFFLIGLFDVSLIATVGTMWFQIPFRGHILVLFAGAILFLLCMLGVGLLISTVSSTQQQAMVTAFFFIMPAITFSGFGFPISTMPQWLQYLTYLSPLRYFLSRASRHLSERCGHGDPLAPDARDDRLGNQSAHHRCPALPQSARLSLSPQPSSQSTQYEAYPIRPRQTAQICAHHTACEVGLLGIVDCHLDDDRTTGPSDCERLFENRLRIAVTTQRQVLYANTPANGGQVIVGKLSARLLSQRELLKLRNLR
jgi:ABC-2 type transport system permease protein